MITFLSLLACWLASALLSFCLSYLLFTVPLLPFCRVYLWKINAMKRKKLFFFSSFLVCLEARRRRSRRRRRRIIDLTWLVASYFEGFFRVTSMSSDCFLIYQGFFEPWLRFSRASLWILVDGLGSLKDSLERTWIFKIIFMDFGLILDLSKILWYSSEPWLRFSRASLWIPVDGLGSLKDSFERALDSWTWIQGWFFFWFTQLWGWGLDCSKLRYGSLWMAWDPWRIGLQHLYGPFKTRLNSWTWIFNSFVTNSCMKSTLTNTTRLN